MARWSKYTDDEHPSGMARVGYDADTQQYTYGSSDGKLYYGEPGNRYGPLTPAEPKPFTPYLRPRTQTARDPRYGIPENIPNPRIVTAAEAESTDTFASLLSAPFQTLRRTFVSSPTSPNSNPTESKSFSEKKTKEPPTTFHTGWYPSGGPGTRPTPNRTVSLSESDTVPQATWRTRCERSKSQGEYKIMYDEKKSENETERDKWVGEKWKELAMKHTPKSPGTDSDDSE